MMESSEIPNPKLQAPGSTNASSETWLFVTAFATTMEEKLQENRHKGGPENWCTKDVDWLLRRLDQEIRELRAAVRLPTADDKVRLIQREAADVANFAMMVSSWFSEEGSRIRHQAMRIV
jgi:NTP pyrophosphatase (non-canonical NTP hydrolase)